ncbi:MAG: FAD-dependent oxidoreductase [Anaerolineaceae bacterium]|nr:FAD-dependent oxidoreductase [Anaerolineaceae bacterium]
MALSRKIRCEIRKVIDHGSHVYTLELIPEKNLPAFRPGQFLHLALDEYDPAGFWPDSRAFSIASSPSSRDTLQITYSVQGQFTRHMELELFEGRRVWVKLPYGEFIIEETQDVVLFAGGTGITAFTAFLLNLFPTFPHSVTLAYGARTSNLLIYRELVDRCAMTVPQMKVLYFTEQGLTAPGEICSRLSVPVVLQHLKNPLRATYYISGPPPMLRTISQDLCQQGITTDAIRIDAWE